MARVLPELGGARLSELRRVDLQDFADRLCADGLDASTVRNTLMPLRVIFRRAVARGDLAVNPTTGLELPAVEGRRERIASPTEAEALLGALPERDRALWATAMYARPAPRRAARPTVGGRRPRRRRDPRRALVGREGGRRRAEEPGRAPRRSRSPASSASTSSSTRSARVVAAASSSARARRSPFTPSNIRKRANAIWARAGLDPIGLHECRHTFASLMIAAGVNAKALSTYMGHSSVTITYDRYGHLMPGNETEAAELLDALPSPGDCSDHGAAMTELASKVRTASREECELRERWLASPHKRPTDFVFPNADGKGLDYRTVGKGFRTAVKAAELEALGKLTLHSLRHGYASLLIANGLNVVFVSRQLGHANPSITLEVYAHLYARADHAQTASAALEASYATITGTVG